MKKTEKLESVIAALLKASSLESRLKVVLQMSDYDNWHNGEYKGDTAKFVPIIVETVKEWVSDGMVEWGDEITGKKQIDIINKIKQTTTKHIKTDFE